MSVSEIHVGGVSEFQTLCRWVETHSVDGKLAATEVRYVADDGVPVATTLAEVAAERVASGLPCRRVRSHARARHYSGLFWSVTNADHVVYESRLELDRLWLADFDAKVVRIAAQPMWFRGRDGLQTRRHVPDFMFLNRRGETTLVDVKPAEFAGRSEVAEVFDWTGRLCRARGWAYEVWTGARPVRLANVRFLGGYRRRTLISTEASARVARVACDGMTIGEVDAAAGVWGSRAATLAMLWSQELVTDLDQPLGSESVLTWAA